MNAKHMYCERCGKRMAKRVVRHHVKYDRETGREIVTGEQYWACPQFKPFGLGGRGLCDSFDGCYEPSHGDSHSHDATRLE